MERESQQGSFPSYYSILGVGIDSSADDIRRAYRKLAMQWHPDRWTRTPSLLSEAKRKFQQIQEAYSVLSDQRKRSLYDVGLYDPDEEEDEGFCDFVEEMMSLMDQNKDKKYSTDELQTMLVEMAQGFEFSSWPCGATVVGDSGYSESMRWNSDLLMGRNSQFDTSKWQMYGTGSYCLHNLIPQSGRCVEQAVIADRRRGTRNNLDNSSSYKTPKLSNSAFF